MQKITLTPAFILHTRRFRETSLILDVFSQQEGRVSLLAKGVFRPRNQRAGLLQAFSPLLFSWVGRNELMTLTQVEADASPFLLQADYLACGFYLNELLSRVLKQHDAHPKLYEIYQHTLKNLSFSANMHSALRVFEKHLLIELGYALPLNHDIENQPIFAEKYYQFIPGKGFKKISPFEKGSGELCSPRDFPPFEKGSPSRSEVRDFFNGASLIALHQEIFSNTQQLQAAKRLLHWALSPLLGLKPLKSREMLCY